jgi:translation initiation factor 4E
MKTKLFNFINCFSTFFCMINKLNTSWVLWYDKRNHNIGSQDWDKFLIRISSFGDIENFCNLLGKVIPLSQLPNGASYHFFRQGIEPRWEDKNNIEGGRWTIVLQKKNLIIAEKLWFLTLTSILGGSFGQNMMAFITGIVGTVKKGQIRIAVWTKNSKDKNLQIKIGKSWKNLIYESHLIEKFAIEFFPHETKIKRKSF